ncbi:aminotransferase class I/II-fold pyridoxal phosphate-dependent enzyme [Bacillus sp. ISL-35]|uniref:aminotransferase class I/II-fold pyridoxal phosphate-dependent enzyme n=1 Tax=Bacillus sp. ISL-35 TaxID=2819122 RepID=UPI001BEA16AF|nr:aminotransferase class I/II-fold pyridoxal phosphate-dependent enzyme [Bacillus sp. ISL-35]MBT2679165.1 aminotransferase class I/II-fold pyridoxal phosphate-dependent enzyme [Bacillus sp. ISL-35]MBT2703534.1 aminotransferase class I/II-fold pyridoxal phosphate-dependent enzyme [Chryseobacterium sp. ISL-80]
MDQSKTPLYSRLVGHAERKSLSFHVPGHKNGAVFHDKGQSFFNDILKLDGTEITGLDDFHSPEGVILEAEELLTDLYKTEKSFFLINGSTVGNLAMILAAVNEDDVVLVQRNSHKSIMNALRLAKARPVFISPEFNREYGVAAGLNYSSVESAIQQYPGAKALILTYPNYYGLTYDLKSLIDMAHRNHIPVLVDEAHGVHFIAGDYFPKSAVELGADLVVQSAHKTLPAMTMGAFLHYQTERVPMSKLKFYLQALQSSSPSYPLMASLDLARSYLGSYNQADLSYLKAVLQKFQVSLEQLESIRVLPGDDPLKLTIRSWSGFELQTRLEAKGIFTELADPYNVLLVLPLLKKNMAHYLQEAAANIKEVVSTIPKIVNQPESKLTDKGISTLAASYKEMENQPSEYIPLEEAAGRVCAEQIIPYPPGIPLCLPGEFITEEDIHTIIYLIGKEAKIQGGDYLHAGKINVFQSWRM